MLTEPFIVDLALATTTDIDVGEHVALACRNTLGAAPMAELLVVSLFVGRAGTGQDGRDGA